MRVHSRIDAYNYVSLFVMLAVLALPLIIFEFSAVYLGVMVVVDVLVVVSMFTTVYELTDEKLIVKSGGIKFSVDYDRILSVAQKNSMFSGGSCGTAIKCLEIRFGSLSQEKPNRLLISPKNEQEFIDKLKNKCKNAKFGENQGRILWER